MTIRTQDSETEGRAPRRGHTAAYAMGWSAQHRGG